MNTVVAPKTPTVFWHRRDALACFLVLLAVYLLTLSGHLYSPDEEAMYYVARGIATGTGVAVPTGDVVPMPLREGLGDQSYAPYGVLPSLLALPFYALGALAALGAPAPIYEYTTRFAVSALNAPLTALTGALLLRFARRLGCGRRAAWLVALGYGLCTFAWPYARTFFSEPLAALLLLFAVERVYVYQTSGNRRTLIVSGLAAGMLLPTRIVEALALPLLAVYVLGATADHRPPTTGVDLEPIHPIQSTIGAQTLRRRLAQWSVVGGRWSVVATWAIALLPGVALLALYNVVRFGTPLATGYGGEGDAFTTPLGVGLYGLLLSPGKSLFLYAPPVLLGVVGLPLLWRRARGLTVLLATLSAAHIVVYAAWHAWDGGGVWGPRLLLPVLPLLMLGAAPVVGKEQGARSKEQGARSKEHDRQRSIIHRVLSVVVVLVFVLGCVNALAGVLVDFGVYVNSGTPARYRYYNAAQSPLLVHWRILGERIAARYGTNQCALADGFYSTEAQGKLLPRYTGARATLACNASTSSIVHLSINDYRVPNAAPSELAMTLGKQRAVLRANQGSQVYVLLPAGGGQLTLTNTTWNPAAAGVDQRDAPVGTLIHALNIANVAGKLLPIVDAAVEPTPDSPRLMWGWYFVPYNHHVFDLWWWYAPRVGLSLGGVVTLAVLIVGASLAALIGAARLLRGVNTTTGD